MMRVRTHAVPDQLRSNIRTARLGVLEFLQYQDACPLSQYEAIPSLVERAGRRLGLVVARRQRLHVAKPGDGQRRNGGFGAPGNHGVRFAHLDEPERFAQRMGRRGTGGYRAVIRPPGAKPYGHQARGHIRNEHGHEERGHPARPLIEIESTLLLEGLDSTDPATDDHTGPIAGRLAAVPTCVTDRHLCSRDPILSVAVRSLGLFAIHVIRRIEILDLARDSRVEVAWIETLNWRGP